MLDTASLVLVEQYIVVVRFLHVLLTWQDASIPVEFVGCFGIQLRSTETEIRCWIRTLGHLLLLNLGTEFAAFQMCSLEISGTVVLARIYSALTFEFRLSTERNIAFVPIESLIKTVGYTRL